MIQEGSSLGVVYFNLTLFVVVRYEGSRRGNRIDHSASIYVVDDCLRKWCRQEVFAFSCNRDLVDVNDPPDGKR
jgi:hypothetical protein